MPLPIVLAEDSPAIRESLIAALIEVADAEVVAVADTAAGAIAALTVHAEVWRLAIIDLFLKAGHGLEVLHAVHARPGQRIFLVTNFATPDVRQRALAAGAHAVFDKSTELDALFLACQALSTGPAQ